MLRRRKAETISKEEIVEQYLKIKGMTFEKACDLFGCSRTQLKKAMKTHELQTKSAPGAEYTKSRFPQLADPDWLEKELETKSFRQIAKDLGTSTGNVADYAYRHGVRWRGRCRAEAVKEALAKKYPGGRVGEDHPRWKGGKYLIAATGYVYVLTPEHPNATVTGYVMEHRLVMEKHLGRYLERDEAVHHINRNRQDNRIENLELYKNGQHIKLHWEEGREAQELKLQNQRLLEELAAAKKANAELTEALGELAGAALESVISKHKGESR